MLFRSTRLDSIKIGSTVLERGTDYTYNATNGTIRLLLSLIHIYQHRRGNALDRQTDLLEKFALLVRRNDNRDVVVFARCV